MAKTFGDTYLYHIHKEYDRKIMEFIMANNEIDTDSDAFADVLFDLKRQNIGVSLISVVTSNNIKLMYGSVKLPSQFKVFAAKDLKGSNNKATKVYIDCSDVLKFENGKYICRSIDVLLSYIVSAMTTLIYHADERRILTNIPLTTSAAKAYATLFTHVIDYVFKISINPELKAKSKYLASMFYCNYVLGKDGDSNSTIAKKISGIGEKEERIININCNDKSFTSLQGFVDTVNNVLKINLTLDILVDKWMFVYGPSTVFGIEFFPAFASMLTDAYCGGYLNNQKTIEKIVGEDMVTFTKTLFGVGETAINGK